MHWLLLLLIALSAGIVSGCRPPSNEPNDPNVNLPDTTKILNAEYVQGMFSIDDLADIPA